MPNKIPSLGGVVPAPDPTKLTTDAVDRAKAEVDIRLGFYRDLVDEKFKGVAAEFAMRDTALQAALKAAEAAVRQQNESNTIAIDKSAMSFTKQIDGLDEKINDLKERMTELASKNYTGLGGYIVGAVGIIAIIATLLFRLNNGS